MAQSVRATTLWLRAMLLALVTVTALSLWLLAGTVSTAASPGTASSSDSPGTVPAHDDHGSEPEDGAVLACLVLCRASADVTMGDADAIAACETG